TERRREKQLRFNREHGITPVGVKKEVRDLIDGVVAVEPDKFTAPAFETDQLDEKQLAREIRRLEKAMLEHARNLEFEQAARARDQLLALRQRAFGASGQENVPLATGSDA